MKMIIEEYHEVTFRRGSFIVDKELKYCKTTITDNFEYQFEDIVIKYDDIKHNQKIATLWNKINWTQEIKKTIVDYYKSKNK